MGDMTVNFGRLPDWAAAFRHAAWALAVVAAMVIEAGPAEASAPVLGCETVGFVAADRAGFAGHAVLTAMRGDGWEQHQVFKRVVLPVAVDMMHDFAAHQLPPDAFLDDKSVDGNPMPPGNEPPEIPMVFDIWIVSRRYGNSQLLHPKGDASAGNVEAFGDLLECDAVCAIVFDCGNLGFG